MFLGLSVPISAAASTLAWDPNPEADLAGYKVHIGASPGAYTQTNDVGHVTTFTVPGLLPGQTYYFVVTAYDIFANESGFSSEVSAAIPNPPEPAPAPDLPSNTASSEVAKIADSVASLASPVGGSSNSGSPSAGAGLSTNNTAGAASASAASAAAVPPSTAPQGASQSAASAAQSGGGAGGGGTAGVASAPLPGAASPRERRAEWLYQEGQRLYSEGRFHEAIQRYKASFRIWRDLGKREEMAAVLARLGAVQAGAGRYEDALSSYRRSLALTRELGNHDRVRELEDAIATVRRLARQTEPD